jgi:hypothetical protein
MKKDTDVFFYWDGSYTLYKSLIENEQTFVGILHDEGKRGNDMVKVWNEERSSWENCKRGNYIVKSFTGNFSVKTKDQINEMK